MRSSTVSLIEEFLTLRSRDVQASLLSSHIYKAMEITSAIDVSNISTVDMTREDLQSQYSALSKFCSQLQTELEEKSQQIYDYKRELTRLNTLEAEYLSEIESLQSEERSEYDRLKLKIQTLEEEKNDVIYIYTEQIECAERDKVRKDEEISRLEEELKALSSSCTPTDNKNEIDELQSTNEELKYQICRLNEHIDVLNEKVESFHKQQSIQQELYNSLQDELDALNENYNCKRFELDEAKNVIETLQEDLMLTKTELETAKNKPLQSGSQGNSLFAEVNDKRVELQDKMAMMKSQYLEMKQERSKLLSEIAILHSTNAVLCQRWDTETKDKLDDEDKLEESYRARIKLLESRLKSSQEEISMRQKIVATNLDSGEIEFMENVLAAKNKEISKLEKEVDSFSLSRTILSHQLRDSKVDMRHWRAKATKFESELGKLQAEIESLKLKRTGQNESVQEKSSYCATCANNNKKSSVKISSTRPKLKDVLDTLSRNSTTLIAEDPFSMVDCSRQIKRSLLKETDTNMRNTETITEIKENTEPFGKLEPEGKKVQFSEETVDNSDNKGKLRKGGKVIHCKPMVLKKRC